MDDKDTIVQLAKMLAQSQQDAEMWKILYNGLLDATNREHAAQKEDAL